MTWGGGLVKSWSTTQGSVALSSGEAEFYAAVKGCKEGIGMKALISDLGIKVRIEVVQDSTAAKGTATRIGIGKIKHLDTGWLWIPDMVKAAVVTLKKIDGRISPADLMTKPTSSAEAARPSNPLGYFLVVRKSKVAGETFTGYVRKLVGGEKRGREDQLETMAWLMEKIGGREGKLYLELSK